MQEITNILIVDDEQEVLNALTRLFRRHYKVHATTEPEHALELLRQTPFAAIISDMRMPKMSGDELLQKAFEISPETPRLLLTGYSDMASMANAINVGKISNYISKPWDNKGLLQLVDKSTEQYHIEVASKHHMLQVEEQHKALVAKSVTLNNKLGKEKAQFEQLSNQLEKKSDNTRNLFLDVVELFSRVSQKATGDDNGHIKRVALHCRLLAKYLALDTNVISRCYLAGLTHEIGAVSFGTDLSKDAEPKQRECRVNRAAVSVELIATIPALASIANIVKHQYECFDGTGTPNHLIGTNIPVESRILAIVNEYDNLVLGKLTEHPLSPSQAQEQMNKKQGVFDKKIVKAYFEMLGKFKLQSETSLDICVNTNQLEAGMVAAQNIQGNGQMILLTKDTELTDKHIEKLQVYEKEWNMILNVFVK